MGHNGRESYDERGISELTPEPFRHEALLYAGTDGLVDGVLPFIRDALEAELPILVAIGAPKIAAVREALDDDAEAVCFADMARLGTNPARIIPAWRRFVDERPDPRRGVRGIGEPIWAGRSDAELVECHRHESLLNLAFADTPGFWLVCPYDTDALEPAVVDEARCTHPVVVDAGVGRGSPGYRGLDDAAAPFAAPLPEPAGRAEELPFRVRDLGRLRRIVAQRASDAGLSAARVTDLMLAVNELTTNSVRHGGGKGLLRMWREPDAVVCEVRDSGRIEGPLAGRQRPAEGQIGGYGLWLANRLCELVQVRTLPSGSVVRVHMRLGASGAATSPGP